MSSEKFKENDILICVSLDRDHKNLKIGRKYKLVRYDMLFPPYIILEGMPNFRYNEYSFVVEDSKEHKYIKFKEAMRSVIND